jgi:hypothetical protein
VVGTIRVIWDGPGVLKDGTRIVAGPGESILVDHFKAEELVGNKTAHYPQRR